MQKYLFKNYHFFFIMAIICILVAMMFDYADSSLVFDGAKPYEFWRLMAAHVVHINVTHLLGNLIAFALLIYMFPISWQRQVQVIILAIVLIDLYLIINSIEIYTGLSGLIYAIPGAYFFQLLKDKKYIFAFLILSILMLYVFVISPQYVNSTNWQPLKAAHLLGFLAGVIIVKDD